MKNNVMDKLKKWLQDMIYVMNVDSFNKFEKDIVGDTYFRKEVRERSLYTIEFCLDVLNKNNEVYYKNMGSFQAVMNLLDVCFEQIYATDYEKGKVINVFFNIPFDFNDIDRIISIDYEDVFAKFNNRGYSLEEIKHILETYDKNNNTLKVPDDLREDVVDFLEKTRKKNNDFLDTYRQLQIYSLSTYENFDLNKMINILRQLVIPEKIIKYYCDYKQAKYLAKLEHRSAFILKEEKPKMKEENRQSKKELKKGLNECCDLSNDKSFSYRDYEKLLWILGKLQYADTVNNSYFNYCYQNRVEDNYYYRFVFEKLKSDKKYKDIMEDILFYLNSMFICSEEDYMVAKEEILKMLDSVGIDTILNFAYENNEIKRVRGRL